MLFKVLLQITVFGLMLAAQYAVVYGFCLLKFKKETETDLQIWRADVKSARDVLRVFGGVAAFFIFLTTLIGQIINPVSWAWPFLALLWVMSVFAVMDFAIGGMLKNQESL